MLNLKSHLEKAETHKLALLRNDAKTLLQQWSNRPAGITTEQKIQFQTLVQAKMTILAIDQFANVITGQVGTRPSLKDKLLVSYGLIAGIKRHSIFKESSFDRIWNLVHNKSWAAGEIQRKGFWSIPTAEFLERIALQAQSRNILEIGAGHGYLAAGLRLQGCTVTAIDDFSWTPPETSDKGSAAAQGVLKLGAREALAQHQPPVVISKKMFSTLSPYNYILRSSANINLRVETGLSIKHKSSSLPQ